MLFFLADDWLRGETASPIMMSMRTGMQIRRDYKEQATLQDEQNKNKIFLNTSKETNQEKKIDLFQSQKTHILVQGAEKEQVRKPTIISF